MKLKRIIEKYEAELDEADEGVLRWDQVVAVGFSKRDVKVMRDKYKAKRKHAEIVLRGLYKIQDDRALQEFGDSF